MNERMQSLLNNVMRDCFFIEVAVKAIENYFCRSLDPKKARPYRGQAFCLIPHLPYLPYSIRATIVSQLKALTTRRRDLRERRRRMKPEVGKKQRGMSKVLGSWSLVLGP
jgi:hypothetical protein